MNDYSYFPECLDEKHSAAILIFLLVHGPSLKSKIYQNISTNPRMPLKLTKLQNAGLLSININRFENNASIVRLTELGEETAELLSYCAYVTSHQERHYNLRMRNQILAK